MALLAAESTDPFQYLPAWVEISPDRSSGYMTVSDFFGVALNVVFGTVIAISMITMIVSGIKFITAKGDPKAAAEAKSALTNSILGFILGIGAYTLKTIIFNVIGGNYGELVNATPNF